MDERKEGAKRIVARRELCERLTGYSTPDDASALTIVMDQLDSCTAIVDAEFVASWTAQLDVIADALSCVDGKIAGVMVVRIRALRKEILDYA